MKKCTFGYVILHYNLIRETLNCIQSIFQIDDNPNIVVVDNCSPNNTGNELKKHFIDQANIHIILLDENVGFAKGNNVGYSYLQKQNSCDFICCINNDTLITDQDFKSKVIKEYDESGFAALAPLVRLGNNTYQSYAPEMKSVQEYKEELHRLVSNKTFDDYVHSLDFLTKILLTYPTISTFLRKIKQHFNKSLEQRRENVVLHGCFLVFSPIMLRNFKVAFDPRTFMYREEELLYIRLREQNLKTVYAPEICITHLENSTTNSLSQTSEEKYQFKRKCQINSLKILIETMENEEIKYGN